MSEEKIAKYFRVAEERYNIKLRRETGLPRPWSTDPIFQNHRFCNVHREDDKTTKWLRENIRDPLDQTYCIHPGLILFAITAFRWFNRIETWENILASGRSVEDIFADWDSDWMRQHLIDHGSPPYVTGAYIIKTPDGKNKVDGVLWCIDEFRKKIKNRDFDLIISGKASQEDAQKLLEQSPYLGRFMAYQIIADARWTQLLRNAPDIYTWAQAGPGSTRGIGRIFYNDVNKFRYGSPADEREVVKLMRELLEASRDRLYWPEKFPEWEMQVVQNWCCEFDKYERCEEGGKMKRRF